MDEHILLALANARAGTGSLIRQALDMAGRLGPAGWDWFKNWIRQPGHLTALLSIAAEAASGEEERAIEDLVDLFTAPAASKAQPGATP